MTGKFCSFFCRYSDNNKAQHCASHLDNGVYCTKLDEMVMKGSPCPFEWKDGEIYTKRPEREAKDD